MAQIINQTPAYHLSGKIVYGQGIGKLVGTPTANLQILSRDEMPPVGVYVTEVLLEGQLYYGVTNIGTSPTVNKNHEISIETLIMNFSRDIHGQQMEIRLFKKLRCPKKFEPVHASGPDPNGLHCGPGIFRDPNDLLPVAYECEKPPDHGQQSGNLSVNQGV